MATSPTLRPIGTGSPEGNGSPSTRSTRKTARRRLAKLVKELAAGRGPRAAAAVASAPEGVEAYANSVSSRLNEGDVANLRVHVIPMLKGLALDEVRPVHIKALRDQLIRSGARRVTSGHILGAARRLFALAIEDEIIEQKSRWRGALAEASRAGARDCEAATILEDHQIRYVTCETSISRHVSWQLWRLATGECARRT